MSFQRAVCAALACVCGVALSVVAPQIAVADSGQVITTPAGGVRNTSALRLSVDTQWVDASGYRDVRLLLTTATGGPSASDRELRIELSPNTYGGGGQFTARQFLELPQGATQTSAHMLVPQSNPWHQVNIRVYEGGSLWKELSSQTGMSSVNDEWSEAIPSFLVIDADAPTPTERSTLLTRYNLNPPQFPETKNLVDIRGLETLVKRGMFYPQNEGPQPADMDLLRRVGTTARLELVPPRGLSDNWLGLTCFDFVIISLADVEQMAAQQSPQFKALSAWFTAGGNLIVYDLGENYERLPQLEKLLVISPATADGDFAAAGWQPAQSRNFNDNTTREFQSMQNYGGYSSPEEPTVEEPPTVTPLETAFGTGAGPKFLTRPAGLGLVVAMATANPFPGSSTEWSWVLNTVGERRYQWFHRHGLSLRRENKDYWNWLVPNTGLAPVWEFCVLISLFAVLIGPVNYFVLLRQKRLYLLLVTIPLGALMVTTGLFLYAVASDGLGTRVRVRSYTYLDQSAGRAATWSRQSYYAGLAPSQGLSFPADAAVYFSEQHPRQEYSGGFQRQRLLVWEDEQNLQAGYMSSRITSQFLVLRSRETTAAVRLDQPIAPKNAQNGLGGEIAQIVVCDQTGELFWAENVAQSAQFALQPTKLEDARSMLKKQFHPHRPQQPPGLEADQFNNWNQWYGGWGIDNSKSLPTTSSSLMEQQLRRLQNATKDTLAPGSYVALMRTNAEVPLGIAGAREEASFHVIEGTF